MREASENHRKSLFQFSHYTISQRERKYFDTLLGKYFLTFSYHRIAVDLRHETQPIFFCRQNGFWDKRVN